MAIFKARIKYNYLGPMSSEESTVSEIHYIKHNICFEVLVLLGDFFSFKITSTEYITKLLN